MIPFNKPYLSGNELKYIEDALLSGKISGNGDYTKKVQNYFQEKFGIGKALMTSSCTDALEMAAMLIETKEGDEIIMPSFTFVSTALAFVREGAKIVFADSYTDQPNIDASKIESLITDKTKAIVVVHYAGVACDMEKIMQLANKYNLYIIEDAAQAIDSDYTFSDGSKKWLGSIGDLSAFSFHETKNIISGEGGLLGINNEKFYERSEILWEKGTNRSQFFRGEVNKYGWVDTGSSFLPSEITSAFLWAQLENLDEIQQRRLEIWNYYNENLKDWANENQVQLPVIPVYATNNAHMFYMVFPSADMRSKMILKLKDNNVFAVFHYLSLHKSPYYLPKYEGKELPNADHFSDCLMRLPLYYELTQEEQEYIVNQIIS